MCIIFWLLFVFICPLLQCKQNKSAFGFFPPGNKRILLSGNDASLEECPYVTSILNASKYHICSATIIAYHWCITTTNCVTNKELVKYIRYNSYYANFGGQIAEVEKVLQHPKYTVEITKHQYIEVKDAYSISNITTLMNDVGLVSTVVEMVVATAIPRPKIVKFVDLTGLNLKVYGFGKRSMSDNDNETYLMFRMVNMRQCDQINWKYCTCGWPINDFEIASCNADYGGPVMFENEIVGVFSLGLSTCFTSKERVFASVFTMLRPYLTTITKSITGGQSLGEELKLIDDKCDDFDKMSSIGTTFVAFPALVISLHSII